MSHLSTPILSVESSDPLYTEAIGRELANKLQPGDFVALYGDLGAGKTAFTRGLAAILAPDDMICSPTYTIVNEYRSGKHLFCHFDMYRIESEDDLESIGFYDYPEDAIFAVEWCEKTPYVLPEHYYRVTILKTDTEDKRQITIERIAEKDTI
ncbi:MAG: tRNA (adenosine(37)-N6)-threonylcarbamoyltransferase complex ATPase subunit type 1 TsaE [Ruminococcaceae bacterium]|nr:tRNA (adenosine(37)-N6)-threonylcarbamoyltransferase complex ATPase subunit type 1 TsaE [Oscillospiraceae bacterium]